jgi:hypothetical protein
MFLNLGAAQPNVRCSWGRSYGTRRGTRFARVHGAIVKSAAAERHPLAAETR